MTAARRRAALLTSGFVVALLAGVPAVGATRTVTMRDSAYQPATVTVRAGDLVSWANGGQLPHDAVADDGSWSTGLLANSQRAAVRFQRAGTWRYHCSIHAEMRGTVRVVAAGAPMPPTDTVPAGADDAAIGRRVAILLGTLAALGTAWLTVRRLRSA